MDQSMLHHIIPRSLPLSMQAATNMNANSKMAAYSSDVLEELANRIVGGVCNGQRLKRQLLLRL